ncbi:PSD1 and planctomycete cytochrome C domain-containing protein [soil metagenome]
MVRIALVSLIATLPMVAAGTAAPDALWSLQPLADPVPPSEGDGSAIDRLAWAEMERHGLTPTDPADPETLLRRMSFGLTGLPPTPAERDAFLQDASSDREGAVVGAIDRLLASPHYGERWGRHWLDLVRYADTAGDNSDYPVPEAHRYRDYVIDAFNADMPYDQFVREQIAGDLLPASSPEVRDRQRIATGYIAISRRFGSLLEGYPYHLTIGDTLDNFGKTFLGLNLSCARCHDHKFDPVSHRDYYALYGIFESTRYAFPGIELAQVPRDFVPLMDDSAFAALMAPYREKAVDLDQKIAEGIVRLEEAELTAAAAADATGSVLDGERRRYTNALRELYKEEDKLLRAERPDFPRAFAVSDAPADARRDAFVQVAGEPYQRGERVPRGFPEALGGQRLDPAAAEGTSGRRELADWTLAHPLAARVMANRIWQYHFGKGLVATPNDFGTRGVQPSHPALLDHLARRLIDSGWSVKTLHREVMGSRVYQLASTGGTPEATAADPENTWLWRHRRTRLDAEALRDAALAVSGLLDRQPLREPHPFPDPKKWDYTQHYPFEDTYEHDKRSLYLMRKRMKTLPFFATFDGADANLATCERGQSVTTPQSLFLMNSPFIQRVGDALAAKIQDLGDSDPARVAAAYPLVFGRAASEAEVGEGVAFATDAGFPALARALLRSNEFLYID